MMGYDNLIPTHLKELATDITMAKKNTTVCRLRCHCGCETFSVHKRENEKTPLEIFEESHKPILPIMESTGKRDKNGRFYWIDCTFFWIPVRKWYPDEFLLPNGDLCYSDVIKAKCTECGKEYIIFDGDLHGYDAMVTKTESNSRLDDIEMCASEQKYKTLRKACGVEVAFLHHISFADFSETFQDTCIPLTTEQYANAFSWITISALVDGKTRVLFDMETS